MAKKVNKEVCVGCGACTGACPVQCIELGEDGLATIDASQCIECGACQATCPVGAIEDEE